VLAISLIAIGDNENVIISARVVIAMNQQSRAKSLNRKRNYLRNFLSVSMIATTCLLPLVMIAPSPTIAQTATTQTIQDSESRSFPIALQSGQFVRILVQQQGIDLVVTLLSPDGKEIATSDSPNEDEGTEVISAIAKVSGEYKLVIKALNPKSSGKFSFVIEDLRKATEADRQYIAAEVAFMTATKIGDGDQQQKQQAIAKYLEALPVFKAMGRTYWEAVSLREVGNIYIDLGQYAEAINYHQQGLALYKQLANPKELARMLNSIGKSHEKLGDLRSAIAFYEQARSARKSISDPLGEGRTLHNFGYAYDTLGQPQEALGFYEQALKIWREQGNRKEEGNTLRNVGAVYRKLSDYAKALQFYQQALAINQEIGDRRDEGNILNSIGLVYNNLGQPNKALDFLRRSLAIAKQRKDLRAQSSILSNIGLAYRRLKEIDKALESYFQAFQLALDTGDLGSQSVTLNNLASIAIDQKNYDDAMNFLQKALVVVRKVGDRVTEARILGNIGLVANYQGKPNQALANYQQSLQLDRQTGNRRGESITLSNMGSLMADQGRMELTIYFYKLSVNVRESIRKDIRNLSREDQNAFKQSVSDVYRGLASILLEQGRVMEALQVLDLLKVQELQDYLQDIKGNDITAQGIELLPQEQSLSKLMTETASQANSLNNELDSLRKLPNPNDAQQARIAEITKIQLEATQKLVSLFNSNNVQTIEKNLKQNAIADNLKLSAYISLQERLKSLIQTAQFPQRTALFYPLILGNRLELVLFIPDAPPIHRTVKINQTDLQSAIASFRIDLQDANSFDVKDSAEKLYAWMIKPIADDLRKHQVQTIIYAPDGQLRYIPLAALYDGKQWLIENYAINHITAINLFRLGSQTVAKPHVIAGAFSQGKYEFNVGTQKFEFTGLPFAGKEVENLGTIIPNTTKLFNSSFQRNEIIEPNRNYNIIHLATHAAFVSGKPEESFILLGNGDRLSLREIQNLKMPAVDLVVLSACQTALGGVVGGGEEILGFGYQMQRTGAKAAIASLWTVSDGGTQALMDIFYGELQKEQFSKVESLRQAQLSLIRNPKSEFKHPYYWSAFILIGNGF
jgi:CHAT domain-containing protein/Tfp pilus assembly protein PilF